MFGIIVIAIFVPLGCTLLSWRYVCHFEVPIGGGLPIFAIRSVVRPTRTAGRYPSEFG